MLIVIGLVVIASFAIAAILIHPEGYQAPHDPRSDLPLWALIGRR